jgi:DNA polymerase/3'-5' exonuclease PolX
MEINPTPPPTVPDKADSSNSELADHLLQIAIYYDLDDDRHRAKTYHYAEEQIRSADFPIESGLIARQSLDRIGPSLSTDIDEFLTLGHINRLRLLEEKHKEVREVLTLFRSIHGIGPVTAIRFFNLGFRTISDLLARVEIEEIRKEIDEIFREFDPHLRWEIVGSYRRGEPTSGDIDILIEAQSDLDLPTAVDLIRATGLIIADLSLRKVKYLGIAQLPDHPARRLDILLVPPENWAYSLAYFTGSVRVNRLMRRRATELGLTLNEFRLLNLEDGTTLPASSEEEIFNYLGIEYLFPDQRVRDLITLKIKNKK